MEKEEGAVPPIARVGGFKSHHNSFKYFIRVFLALIISLLVPLPGCVHWSLTQHDTLRSLHELGDTVQLVAETLDIVQRVQDNYPV